jgi:hypothetical protein
MQGTYLAVLRVKANSRVVSEMSSQSLSCLHPPKIWIPNQGYQKNPQFQSFLQLWTDSLQAGDCL